MGRGRSARAALVAGLMAGLGWSLAACGAETVTTEPTDDDGGPAALEQHEFSRRIDAALDSAIGLRWTKEERTTDGFTSVQRGVVALGAAGKQDRTHLVVTSDLGGGELIDVGHTLCHQGLYTGDVPLQWPELPADKPWNCLPQDASLWAVVEPRHERSAPHRYFRALEEWDGWTDPVPETVDGERLMRYAFDDHEVWLDADDLPRLIRTEDEQSGRTEWTVAPEASPEVALPPRREQTHVTPGFGWGQVGKRYG